MSTPELSLALPADSCPAAAREHAHERFHGRTVLLVDDDTSVLSLLGETMAAMGHKVIVAHDGPDALRCLLRNRSIDCLFTDVVMPNGMTGVQLMAAARAVRPGLPAVIASAYPREDVCAMGDIPSDVNFIAKPYLLTDLYPLLDGAPPHKARGKRKEGLLFLRKGNCPGCYYPPSGR
jgi:DNA-binding NtrC family response regulator